MDLTLSLWIENLLINISPACKGMRDMIENKPYETISEVLQYRLPKGAEVFAYNHKNMENLSISQLQTGGYDIETLKKDLKDIINRGE